ncbi:twin-arginine translocase TatA/TatE family subunit [Halalkalibacterium halodurans]|uniref:twin-arginine translocase TatA/TatE family subunit n=1 Tax=Halalkalibacterium halodurans TaxID=86665 RepID=UPI002AA9B6B4|nr:twin-arginine translocase TatA/TatE family subunit [Halalkalibacterium halodurans]MDY7221048.1 twin-arginine translocase TatA/TatE family subunit [Halalkalibacterium halodurans]MDY7240287.1 twin-arginine translocase TatA/TatE family subunit [Halalkalibacterium halodurans]MED4079937.1 twin-arginine translocase TatA/TatE family subunit [Halalkalibacterium halodurans]MED4086702.1 twin-arginine translocase TatA/TatE family subunit [Halalkalibacterium halodurans]MED4103750.1 twin-arginine transl
MPGGLGPMSILIIALVALLIFGPKKLPELGKAAGNTLREFKNATKGLADEDDDVKKKNENQQNGQ